MEERLKSYDDMKDNFVDDAELQYISLFEFIDKSIYRG